MDRLCTPWRFSYVTGKEKEEGCVFCNRLECDDEACFVLHRGDHWYIILNRYPYNSGHLLLVLNRHHPDLGDARPWKSRRWAGYCISWKGPWSRLTDPKA